MIDNSRFYQNNIRHQMESNYCPRMTHDTQRHQLPEDALPTLVDLLDHLVFLLWIKSTYGSL